MSPPPNPDPLTRIGRFLGFALVAAFLLWFLYEIRLVLLLLAASLLVQYGLEPLVQALSGHNPRRRPLGIGLTFVALSAALVLMGVLVLGPALRAAASLVNTLAGYAQSIQAHGLGNLSTRFSAALPVELRSIGTNAAGQLATWLSQIAAAFAGQTVAWARELPTFAAYVGIVFSMSGLLLADAGYFRRQAMKIVPTAWIPDVEYLLDQSDQALAAYIRGQLLVAGVVGLLLTIGMLLLRINYAVPIGLFAAVTQLIPVIGGAIGLVGAVIVAAFQSTWAAIEVLVLFSVMFFISGNILGPRIMGQQVTLHPLVILVVTIAGTLLGGVPGLLLSVPITAILRILIVFFYHRYAAAWGLGGAVPAGGGHSAAPPDTRSRT